MARVVATFGINRELLKLARKDGLQILVRAALREAALWWFKKILPGHFKENAPNKYKGDYSARARRTRKDKRKRFAGRNLPMVWSGDMRRQTLKGKPTFQQFKSPRSVRVKLNLPYAQHANFWRNRLSPTGRVINFDRELTAMTGQERGQICKLVEKLVRKSIPRALESAGMKIEKFAA